jgi:AAA15 family ATPase/GTPase
MNMYLNKFRVTDFRSIVDTGWIECQSVTAFAGENEAGKTTLLLALLKLMDPNRTADLFSMTKANSGKMAKIVPAKDLPIDRYDELKEGMFERIFVRAEFTMTDDANNYIMSIEHNFKPVSKFLISKTYGSIYDIDFLSQVKEDNRERVIDYIVRNLPNFMYYKEVTEIDSKIDLLGLALKLNGSKKVRKLTSKESMFSNLLKCLDIWESNLIKSIISVYEQLSLENRKAIDFRQIFERIPEFQQRIYRGFKRMNQEFMKWWGKDELTIAFEPYNKGILIKIIDKKGREFLLESRSTGFRRFFALFLSFSIAGSGEYENSILLFDEAGAALHPLTQVKLANYFDELGKHTQLMFNTHTSYMLSVAQLNRVRVVYKDATNHTSISKTLTINEDRSNEMSLFPVQSTLALHLAEKTLAGCVPIVVLNEEDQYYLSLVKNILTAKGKLRVVYETLVFSTGENGIDAAAETFSAGDDLPVILLTADDAGHRVQKRLLQNGYKNAADKVLMITNYLPNAKYMEDIIPSKFVEIFSRLYLTEILGEQFRYDKTQNLVDQIETYAAANRITLPKNYRGEMAKRMKLNTMMYYRDVKIPGKYIRDWMLIWKDLLIKS